MKQQDIKILINRCVDYLSVNGYSQNRIKEFRRLWTCGVVKLMNSKGITMYTPQIGEEFENILVEREVSKPVLKEKTLSVRVLNDMLLTNEIRKRDWHYVRYDISGVLTDEINRFLNHLIEMRRSEKTLGDYKRILSGFQKHLQQCSVVHISDIDECYISAFVNAYPSNKPQVFHTVHTLFRYWISEHLTDIKWSDFFRYNNIKHKERICSFYTTDEVHAMEQSIHKDSTVGKRDYAMMLLASRLGLRAHDIADIKFSDIDWENNLITIITQKTGKKVELPLLAEVGNAIIDYLKYARKESNADTVFLSCHPPFGQISATTVSTRFCKLINKSGVEVNGRHHGSHCLRHSLATAMLTDGSTIPIISETLGHRSSQTTMSYIKVDIQTLRKCSLSVPPVSEEFYLQEGGYFYE